jgi:serine/threonine-protein kinase
VTRALSRDPGERYPTARAMALALEACMPPVRLTEIGSWVERMVGDTLQGRSAVLARIERKEAEARMASASPEQHPRVEEATQVTPRYAQETPPTTTIDGATETEHRAREGQSGFLARPVAVPERAQHETGHNLGSTLSLSLRWPLGRHGAGWMIAGAALLLAAVGGLAWMRWEQQRPKPTARTGSGVETAPPLQPSSEVGPPAAPDALSGSARELPVVSAAGVPTASTTTSGPPQTRPAPGSPPARTARPKQPANPCKPPYYIDSLGREIFRPECL